MEIRKAEEKDIDIIVNLWYEMHVFNERFDDRYYAIKPKEEALKIKRKSYLELIKDPDSILIIMESDGKVIGYVNVKIIQRDPVYEVNKIANVQEVSVTKEFREKGFFSTASIKIMQILKSYDIKLLTADVDLENPAISSYWKLNYYKRAFKLICWTEDTEEFMKERLEKKQKRKERKK